jgi:hypothetical protein
LGPLSSSVIVMSNTPKEDVLHIRGLPIFPLSRPLLPIGKRVVLQRLRLSDHFTVFAALSDSYSKVLQPGRETGRLSQIKLMFFVAGLQQLVSII